MQLNTLIFMVIGIAVLFTGYGVLIADFSVSFPSIAANTTYIANMNATVANMTVLSDDMTDEMWKATTSGDAISAFLGYVGLGINAVKVLIAVPGLVSNVVGLMLASTGFFLPTWFVPGLLVSITFIFVVGVLKYLMKV